MEFSYAYAGSSAVADHPYRTAMSFAPDTLRQPTFFSGRLRRAIAFREAISALHDVVVSDLRYKPKDRTAYKAWLAQQEQLDWALVAEQRAETTAQLRAVQAELAEIGRRQSRRWSAFYGARQRYFDYIYKRDYAAWLVLDPVITVHPDQVFFECFSKDESSYGKLAASYEIFEQLGERSCGTTNIDYSQVLYDEFQKIRSYKITSLQVDPSGFGVQTATDDERLREVKIDLPDSWVRGFLQVSSAMSLQMAASFELHPMDIHNVCLLLRRNRELVGPRSMRFSLAPGEPVRVVLEPWNLQLRCARSIYHGPETTEIRLWGRRRIHVLERLIPIARRFVVHLLGSGMPSFWVADLGDMSFTLGLSGWSANDWSRAGNFDLMAPRAEVDELTKRRVFAALKENWLERPDDLARRLELDRSVVLGALGAYTQAGRAIYDLEHDVYRVRELSREPLPGERLRFANDREREAVGLLSKRQVKVKARALPEGGVALVGLIRQHQGRDFRPSVVIDGDERLVGGECSCRFFFKHKLYRGPCEHMLALRLAHNHPLREQYELAAAEEATEPPAPPAPQATDTASAPAGSGQWAVGTKVTVRSGPLTGTEATVVAPGVVGDRCRVRFVAWGEPTEQDLALGQLQLAKTTKQGRFSEAVASRLTIQALEEAVLQLAVQGLIEVRPHLREDLIDELYTAALAGQQQPQGFWQRLKQRLGAGKRAGDATERIIEGIIAALFDSERVEEVYADDEQLVEIFKRAFEQTATSKTEGS